MYTTNAGGSWSYTVVDTTGTVGRYSSIILDSNGKVHISYCCTGCLHLRYATNAAGHWGTPSYVDSAGVGGFSSIALDSNNKVHISYFDGANGNLKYASNVRGNWGDYPKTLETIDDVGIVGKYTSIVVNANDQVKICYYDNTTNVLKFASQVIKPSAPTLISATSGDGQVDLNWAAPSNDGGASITNYMVYRGNTSGGETLITNLSNVLVYNDANVTNGHSYFYKVSAVSSVGEGLLSNELNATPARPPSAPQNLEGVSGDAFVYLAWEAPSSDGGFTISNYEVWRGVSSGPLTFWADAGLNLWYNNTGLTNGLDYHYVVKAENTKGVGPGSNEVVATPRTLPSAPQGLDAVRGNGQVVLSWSAPADDGGASITNYTVYRDSVSGNETPLITLGNVLTYTNTELTNGQTYYYKISAVNSVGEGTLSEEASATPASVPSAPTFTAATPGNGQVDLSWNAPQSNGAEITNYKLYRGTSVDGETWLITLGDVQTYTDSDLDNGEVYYYKVSAVNAVGEGAWSTEVEATPIAVPSVPLGLHTSVGDSFVDLQWTEPDYSGPGTITYHLFRNGSEIWSGALLSYTDVDVANGVTYSYTVAAQNSVGWGPNSTAVLGTPISGDTTPTAPRGLMVTAGNEQVDLQWTAPAYIGPGTLIYHLFRDGVDIWSGTETTATDEMLTKGVQYSYTVAAVNTIGWGPNSTAMLATPLGVPDAPWGLNVTPGDGLASLGWNVVNYTGPGLLTYHLFRDGVEVFSGTTNSYIDNGVVNGRSYAYNVAASNSIGWSDNSTSVSGMPLGPPSAPTGLKAGSGDGFIKLNWTVPTYVGPSDLIYHLFRNGTMLWSGISLTYNDTAVVNGISYSYTVAAQSSLGWSANSSTVSAIPSGIPITTPSSPGGLEIIAGDGEVRLTWEAPSQSGSSAAITGYNVYRGNSTGTYTLIATVTGTNYTDDDVTNGQAYHYKVSAVNSVGEGELTEDVVITPAASGSNDDNGMTSILIIIAVVAIVGVLGAIWFARRKK
jgi:fibronectin type 3 domain-containing protein